VGGKNRTFQGDRQTNYQGGHVWGTSLCTTRIGLNREKGQLKRRNLGGGEIQVAERKHRVDLGQIHKRQSKELRETPKTEGQLLAKENDG